MFLAFAAGLLSFLSPCVLPLIPSYLSILGGVGLNAPNRSQLLRTAVSFVLGFSAVFIALGILISATFHLMGGITRYITWVGGIIVIVLGLNVIFDFFSFLNYEKRPFLQRLFQDQRFFDSSRLAAAFVAGAAFATGWTPCIGPILTGILFMAGQSGQTGTAVFFLAAYSAGLALPFVLAALFFDSFLKHASRLRSYLPLVQRVSGIILVAIGLMILTGHYSAFTILAQRLTFGYIEWAEGRAFPFRLLADWLAWLQNF